MKKNKLLFVCSLIVNISSLAFSGLDLALGIVRVNQNKKFIGYFFIILGIWLFIQGLGGLKLQLNLWREIKNEGDREDN